MTEEEITYSERLMQATDEIVRGLKPGEIKGAINWGDLGCVAVEKVESFCGTRDIELAWRVVIEEAAPGSYELASAVHSALSSAGFKNVEVATDW